MKAVHKKQHLTLLQVHAEQSDPNRYDEVTISVRYQDFLIERIVKANQAAKETAKLKRQVLARVQDALYKCHT